LDGATNVAADGPFTVEAWLDDEQVALGGSIVLNGPDGEVPVDLSFDGSLVTVWPNQPLPDGDYALTAFSRPAQDDQTHGHRTGSSPRSATSQFHIGSTDAQILALFEADGGLYLQFSEPIDVDSLADRVVLSGTPVDVLAIDDDLVTLIQPGIDRERTDVELLAGVLTLDGRPVTPIDELTPDWRWNLDRTTGGTWCDCL
jgi:hypothetical protein